MKKSPNSSFHIKISDIAVKVTERTAADTSKSSLFNWGQGYNTKENSHLENRGTTEMAPFY